jgi:aldehyde:ferredoxin oxidoreductase
MDGFTGKFLRVNLSKTELHTETVPEQVRKYFMGGRGFGIKYLYDEVASGVDPLGPENKLLLLNGPLAGTNAQSCSRWAVYTKSPLTGTVMRGICGGDFGAWMKWAGLDFIIIEGKAEKPVYLYIEEGRGDIRDASEVWSNDTVLTQESLRKIHGPNVRTACIGPAGERLVLYSAICSGRRTASRGGTGTVMGSKNLKAVAINAKRRIKVHDPIAFAQLVKEQIRSYRATEGSKIMLPGFNFKGFSKYGTGGIQLANIKGYFPVRNFRYGVMDGYKKLTTHEFGKLIQQDTGCYGCMIRCGKIRTVRGGLYDGASTEGPEFDSIWAFSGAIDSDEIGPVIAADALCDDLGLDTVSTGNTIGFAFELFERGLITSKDTDGFELTWGNSTVLLPLIRKIARREGFGDLLADGTKRMAERIGKNSIEYAMQVKGLELPAYDPRGCKAQGFSFATSNMGANHNYGYAFQEVMGLPFPRAVDRWAEVGNGDIVKFNQDYGALSDTPIVCAFPWDHGWLSIELVGKLLLAATGIAEFEDPDYLMKVGERICNLERCFNARDGFSRKDDTLPRRFLEEPLQNGPAEGQVITHLDALLDEYYDLRGWTRDGIPTSEKLEKLRLSTVIKDIEKFMK